MAIIDVIMAEEEKPFQVENLYNCQLYISGYLENNCQTRRREELVQYHGVECAEVIDSATLVIHLGYEAGMDEDLMDKTLEGLFDLANRLSKEYRS